MGGKVLPSNTYREIVLCQSSSFYKDVRLWVAKDAVSIKFTGILMDFVHNISGLSEIHQWCTFKIQYLHDTWKYFLIS